MGISYKRGEIEALTCSTFQTGNTDGFKREYLFFFNLLLRRPGRLRFHPFLKWKKRLMRTLKTVVSLHHTHFIWVPRIPYAMVGIPPPPWQTRIMVSGHETYSCQLTALRALSSAVKFCISFIISSNSS